MKKQEIKNIIIVVLFGLGLIAMGLFTDYTITIAKIAIPSWLTVAVGVIIIIIMIIGWFSKEE